MILLTSTSDLVRVVTTQAISTHVHASWVDLSGSTTTPGRQNTPISTATTTTVVPSPGSSTFRTLQTLTIRNIHPSTTQVVTIVHTDGTNAMELIRAELAAGEVLQYHEAAGFWTRDIVGRAKTAASQNQGFASTDNDTIVRLTSDVINNNAVANTLQDVTGLSFAVTNAKMYWFRFQIAYTAAATSTGSRWTISGPAAPTYLNYWSFYSLTTTTRTDNTHLQAYDQPAASNASSAATGNNWARIEGIVQPSTDGTLIARFASEVANSAITAKINSHVRYRQITP